MPIHNSLDQTLMQEDLDSLCVWASDWNLEFKANKCVHLQCNTSKYTKIDTGYKLNEVHLKVTSNYRDLGVIISSDLSFTSHYDLITTRAYRILGLLRRTFSSNIGIHEKLTLYISLVRSQLLYCSTLWRPYLLMDILQLKHVQRRATKYILNDYRMDYKTRLIY